MHYCTLLCMHTSCTTTLNDTSCTPFDAILFLTVYPKNAETSNGRGPADALDLQQKDIDFLVNQLDAITNPYTGSSRRVMLRFAPEMNGNWFRGYSQRPTAWKAAYKKIVDAVRAKTNRVSFVWSPNVGNNYPFGKLLDNAEISALDTTGDNQVTFDDSPYAPYWPGADYVDWIGISLYWKGSDGMRANDAPPPDFVEQMLFGSAFTKVNPAHSLYRDFCEKYNKPLVLSEGAAALHEAEIPLNGGAPIPLDKGVGHLGIAQAFWRSFITNTTFLKTYPRFKMFNLFEHTKDEEDKYPDLNIPGINRDFRMTSDPALLAAFKADLDAVATNYAWAGPFRPGTDPLKLIPKTSGTEVDVPPPSVSGGATSAAPAATLATTTAGGAAAGGAQATVAVTTTTTKPSGAASTSVSSTLVALLGVAAALLVL
ncbi:hypothetical protein HDU96_001963 [Phlyctochytrium bullatum]|nr:hypothetical protein HDU96_001963 [Phlyctochytrium bullatum]